MMLWCFVGWFVFQTAAGNFQWFGPNNMYMCRCQNDICDVNGRCLVGSTCVKGWFGPDCQYKDVAYNTSQSLPEITDGDDSTCLTSYNTTSVIVDLHRPYLLTWMRVVTSRPDLLPSLEVVLFPGGPLCKTVTVNFATIDVHCDQLYNDMVFLFGPGAGFICSVYVSGGRNVALRQNTSQSGSYSQGGITYGPEKSVDGNTNGEFKSGQSCSRTDVVYYPWWTITLPRPQIVNRYVLYSRIDGLSSQDYLKGFNLRSFGENGATIYNYTEASYTNQAMYEFFDYNPHPLKSATILVHGNLSLNMCEVELYGDAYCNNGTYGRECDKTCNCLNNSSCFVSTGGCPTGCKPGYYGEDCKKACPKDKYGPNCGSVCDRQCFRSGDTVESSCHYINGKCRLGCESGYTGDFCNQTCPKEKFGPQCNSTCNANCGRSDDDKHSSCQYVNGTCLFGCLSGYQGSNCSETCSPGTYGPQCNVSCNANCIKRNELSCDHDDVRCLFGCPAGYTGLWCIDRCSGHLYGPNCSSNCNYQCAHSGTTDTSCHHFNGSCIFGCLPGFKSSFCNEDCEDNKYGVNCTSHCSSNCKVGSCDKINGSCLQGCVEGYLGALCDTLAQKSKTSDNTEILPVVVGSYVVVVIVAMIVGGILERRCKGKKSALELPMEMDENLVSAYINLQPVGSTFNNRQTVEGNYINLLTGESTYNNLQTGESTNNNLQTEESTYNYVQTEGSTYNYIQTGGSTYNNIQTGGSTFNNIQTGGSTNNNFQTEGSTYNILKTGESTNNNLKTGGSTYNNIQTVGSTYNNLQTGESTNNNLKTGGSTYNNIQTVGSTYNNFQKGESTCNNIQTGESTNNKLQTGESISNNLQTVPANTKLQLASVPSPKLVSKAKSTNTNKEDGKQNGELSDMYCNTVSAEDTKNTAIPLKKLPDFLKSKDLVYFQKQFNSIPINNSATTEVGTNAENQNKNRYKNIVAYDHSRVHLIPNPDKKQGDYINASYVNGFIQDETFIASQSPTNETIEEFVRMLWEQKVDKVVMLTTLVEDGKQQCERYWPEEGEMKVGEITVKLKTTQTFADYTIRRLNLRKEVSIGHNLTHFHFTTWPDKDVPSIFWGLVHFEQRVALDPTTKPTVVHCSTGVDRTGTFIALRNVMKQAEETGEMDFFQTVKTLRRDRVNMVQTVDEYIFLHQAALIGKLRIGTTLNLANVCERIEVLESKTQSGKSKLELEFESMCDACEVIMKETSAGETNQSSVYINCAVFIDKSRTVISEMNRPYSTNEMAEFSQYLNAVFVPSLNKPNHQILTQLPLPTTVTDFWRLVTQYQVSLVVALLDQEEVEDGNFCDYWPVSENEQKNSKNEQKNSKNEQKNSKNEQRSSENKHKDFPKSGVRTEHKDKATLRHENKIPVDTNQINKPTVSIPTSQDFIQVNPNKLEAMSLFSVMRELTETATLWRAEKITVQVHNPQQQHSLLHLTCQPPARNPEDLLNLTEYIRSLNMNGGRILFMCRDGAHYSGLVHVMSILLDRMDIDGYVTVPLVVGAVKAVRPEVIPTVHQYRLLYHALQIHSERKDIFSPITSFQNKELGCNKPNTAGKRLAATGKGTTAPKGVGSKPKHR